MSQRFISQGSTLTASAINPFDRSYNELQNKFDLVVLNLLSELCSFTVSFTKTPLITDLGSYELYPNVWIFEQILNGTCQISSTTMILTPEMTYPIPYSLSIGYFRPQLFYKARSVREEYNIYYIPFSSDVWISLFSLLLIVTMALTFILGRETKLPHDTPYDIIARIADEKHDEGMEWNDIGDITSKETLTQRERWEIGEILLVAIGALGQQGSARDPSTSAARTLLLVMFILAVLAYTAYSASVISLVSLLPNTEKEQNSITKSVPLERSVVLHDTNFFRHSFQSIFTEVTYADVHKGLDDAITGQVLFVGDQDLCLTYIHKKGYGEEQRCSLARAFLGIQYQRVFAFRKNAEFKELVNINLIRLQELGLLSREKKRFFDVRYPCSFKERSSVSGFVSFTIQDIKPALCLFGSGALLSLLLLLLESFAFSSSKMIAKIFFSCWTANDERIKDLASRFIKLRTRSDGLEKWKDDESKVSIKERNLNMNPLPFIH